MLFDDLLKTQLVLKGIITEQDWDELYRHIEYVFTQDAYYTESKEQEMLRSRIELLGQLAPYDGQYVTKKYIQQHILRFTEEEVEEMDKEIEQEQSRKIDYTDPKTSAQNQQLASGVLPTPPQKNK